MVATVDYPVEVDATLDAPLSRWLWLVKWFLLIPHFVVLVFLWVAFVVTSVVAFVAILVTGHYPRAIFDFNVGVLRWTWRVQYYAYGALGTDRYPPFSLAPQADYPAHLEIAYPDHLSRGLVLVKWWLLAIPHYIIAGFFVGGGSWVAWRTGQDNIEWGGGGLIGILVLIAGVALLFTGRYPRAIYDFVLGLNRWVLRVAAYAGLMTDRYPPFRLDMGGHEPRGTLTVPDVPLPPETWPAGLTESPPTPSAPPPPTTGWSAGRVIAVVAGSVLGLMSAAVGIAGGALLVVDDANRDDSGYLGLGEHGYATSGYAIASQQFRLTESGPSAFWLDNTVGKLRITVTSTDPTKAVFVGIARASTGERYVSGMDRLVVGSLEVGGLPRDTTHVDGGPPAVAPTEAGIWVSSTAGTGTRTLTWAPQEGSWTVVAMNSDGSPAVDVRAEVSATAPALAELAYALLGAGVVLLAGSALLVIVPVRRAVSG